MIQNPFESGQIKNYLAFYAGVIIIVVLFFIATSLFHDIEVMDKKEFATQPKEKQTPQVEPKAQKELPKEKSKLKLLEKVY